MCYCCWPHLKERDRDKRDREHGKSNKRDRRESQLGEDKQELPPAKKEIKTEPSDEVNGTTAA